MRAGGVAHGHGIEPVLRLQSFLGVGSPQAGADDRPIRIVRQQVIDIDGHMRPVKRADPEMDDAGRDLAAVIIGHADPGRNIGEGAGAEARHGQTPD
jgi:hypothetical protein